MVRKKVNFSSYGISNRIKLFFLISIIVTILDQISKLLVVKISVHKLIVIPHFLWFTLVRNEGAAFGILSNGTYILGLVNLLVFFMIIYYNFKTKLTVSKFLPLAFVAGGALGNAIDRLLFGSVVDFIDLGWFAIFNIADSFIVIGFIYLLISEYVDSRK